MTHPHGFFKVGCVCPRTHITQPQDNVRELLRFVEELASCQIILTPELSLTGYTCADLFFQDALYESAWEHLVDLMYQTRSWEGLLIVGIPWRWGNSLYNVAAILHQGRLLGLVPKTYLPNYREFYEQRWFSPADERLPRETTLLGGTVPVGTDLLFELGPAVVAVELCEDLWAPIPPSSLAALAGANILLNLSASNEIIGKARYRTDLVVGQSGRCVAGYAYASAGPWESTTDLVFGGHCLIAENGVLLAESPRVGDGGNLPLHGHAITAEIDVQRLQHDRQLMTSFAACARRMLPHSYRRISCACRRTSLQVSRSYHGQPFVPADSGERRQRCAEIFGIQCAALGRRVQQLPGDTPLVVGISGGLDSTLALLVAVKTCDQWGWPRTRIRGLTLPGFGTTLTTRHNAWQLMQQLGIQAELLDIRSLCANIFTLLNHSPFGLSLTDQSLDDWQQQLSTLPPEQLHDLTFENVQARVRTLLLMSRGFVIGTGDLSEAALGWSTYNADHMSMYNPNASIPKTLVRYLVQYVADHEFDDTTREVLHRILATPISPELLPVSHSGCSPQATEETLGPYELHDFFLYHLVRFGCSPAKLLFLAEHAQFSRAYTHTELRHTLRVFLQRFFVHQYKRSCIPDGPKVGSVSLSPRGDWRMPSDISAVTWLCALDRADDAP